MKKEQYLPLVSFFSSLLIYLGISFLPIQKWVEPLWAVNLIQSGIYLVLLLILFLDSKDRKIPDRETKPSYFYLLPFLLLCCSNFLYVLFFRISPNVSYQSSVFFSSLFLTLIKTGIEEVLFRKLLLVFTLNLRKQRKHKEVYTILLVSICFGLRHAINYYGSDPLSVTSQIGYTFFLSLFLTSYSILYSSTMLSYLFHFLFNLLNSLLFTSFFKIETTPKYFIFSIILGFILLLFYLLLWFIKYKGKKKHAQPEL